MEYLFIMIETPKSLKNDHAKLLLELKDVAAPETEVAQKAEIVANKFHSHFIREERSVLPHLSLLLTIANGQWNVESDEILSMTDKLLKEFYELQEEHKKIIECIKDMIVAAKKENNNQAEKLADKLTLHIEIEEEVLYPAVMLIDKYLNIIKPKNN